MHLKSLRITGFKSFADTVELSFDQMIAAMFFFFPAVLLSATEKEVYEADIIPPGIGDPGGGGAPVRRAPGADGREQDGDLPLMSAVSDIALIALFILIGGTFAAAEMALVTLRESQIRQLAAKGKRGRAIERLTSDPNRFLSAVQIGVTLSRSVRKHGRSAAERSFRENERHRRRRNDDLDRPGARNR